MLAVTASGDNNNLSNLIFGDPEVIAILLTDKNCHFSLNFLESKTVLVRVIDERKLFLRTKSNPSKRLTDHADPCPVLRQLH